jgi:hypothetical protein
MSPCRSHGCYWGRACVFLSLTIAVAGFVALHYVSAWMK